MNIQNLVNEILATGLSQQEVADLVGCSQPTISDLSRGDQKTTNLQLGLKIIDLHKNVTEKAA